MKFGFEDREYDFDATLTVEEAMILQDRSGLGVNEVDEALTKGNPYAIAAWMFILKRRAGEAIRWQDMLKLDIRTYRVIPDEAPAPGAVDSAASGGETKPDPTPTNGKTRKRATTSIS